ncbi:hypothetical protein DRH29_04150 [candidate division Kazan bacterium]|uniref:Uncharacterized protein n=1 Tax=candidate division Kazan bacterium TaxID=2202143 RepID=A0A420ZBV6_UNCK3|nr:MAG: hypothetical protein DRH29_04150 [candidate division Kazan bacterium]
MDTMKPITITINPPITEYCEKCDYEAAYSFNILHHKCPKCGAASIRRGARPKPQNERPISIMKSHGSYDLLHPNEKQFCYVVYNCPDGRKYPFLIDEDIDISDPLEAILELHDIINGFLWSSYEKDINQLYELVNDPEERERQERLRLLAEKEELERKLYKIYYYLNEEV